MRRETGRSYCQPAHSVLDIVEPEVQPESTPPKRADGPPPPPPPPQSSRHFSRRSPHPPPPQRAASSQWRAAMDRDYLPDDCPSYYVEHLSTFGVGPQFGLQWPSDGIRKLKQMERSSALWAQRMILRLQPNAVVVLDENGDAVETFPLELISEPTAYVSNDSRDLYNNLLVFVVNDKGKKSAAPTEMHIFQCVQVSATQVADDIKHYLRGQFRAVAPGRRGGVPFVMSDAAAAAAGYGNQRFSTIQTDEGRFPYRDADQKSTVSNSSMEFFERDVNTLNRCFDDIERFVARIQSAAIAQRELEALQQQRQRQHQPVGGGRSSKGVRVPLRHPTDGILLMRAQLPTELEFYDILQKFKLCFNLLAKLKNHIHEPNAPELLHFLFTPLAIIMDACHWAFGRNLAPQVVSPLISRQAKALLLNCLTSKESEVWASLGDSWRITAEEWRGPLPGTYTPTFADAGYVPYNSAAETLRPSHGAVDTQLSGEMSRVSLEQERLDFEKEKLQEEERRIIFQKRALEEERRRLMEEKRQFYEEQEQRSVISERMVRAPPPDGLYSSATLSRSRPELYKEVIRDVDMRRDMFNNNNNSSSTVRPSQQRAYFGDARSRGGKMAQVTYERPGQNSKELSVRKGEFLQVLDDRKNWWQCRNMNGEEGYVPHTILSLLDTSSDQLRSKSLDEPLFVRPPASTSTFGPSAPGSSTTASQAAPTQSDSETLRKMNNSTMNNRQSPVRATNGDTPEVVRQRRGKLEENEIYASNTLKRRQVNWLPVACEPPVAPPLPSVAGLMAPAVKGHGGSISPASSDTRRPSSSSVDGTSSSETNSRRLLSEELQLTLKQSQLNDVFKLKSPVRNTVRMQELSCVSNSQDVNDWLRAKGFSNRAIDALRGKDGETVLKMTKVQLEELCGVDEGSRIYSQLLMQKRVRCINLPPKKATELECILAARKSITDDPRRVRTQSCSSPSATAGGKNESTVSSEEEEDSITIAL